MRVYLILILLFIGSWTANAQATKAKYVADFNANWVSRDSTALYWNWLNDYPYDGAQIYYASWNFGALLRMWQATGDERYYDNMKKAIDTLIYRSTPLPSPVQDYQGWKAVGSTNSFYANYGVPLYEFFFFRYVATLLRVLYDSPILRASDPTKQSDFDNWLAFTEKNIWDKWNALGTNSHVYRVNDHMTSHSARVAMELHYITGKADYLDKFNKIMFEGMPSHSTYYYDHIWDRLEDDGILVHNNSLTPTGYYSAGDFRLLLQVNDYSHWDDVIQFFVEAYWLGYLPVGGDMDGYTVLEGIVEQIDQVVWDSGYNPEYWYFKLNGTGGLDNMSSTARHTEGYMMLGLIFPDFMTRFNNAYVNAGDNFPTSYRGARYSVGALWGQLQENTCPEYPENWGGSGSCGSTGLPPILIEGDGGKFKKKELRILGN